MKTLWRLLDQHNRERPFGLWWASFEDLQPKNDEELIKIALDLNPFCLVFAGKKARNNRRIIREIFGKWSNRLKTLANDDWESSPSHSLRSDYQWIFENLILVAGEEVRQDDDFCQSLGFQAFSRKTALRAIDEISNFHEIISPKCWFDRKIVSHAIRKDASYLVFASQALREDKEICLEAIRLAKCDALDFVGDNLTSDKDFMVEAMKIDKDCLMRIGTDLENDPDIIRTNLENYPNDMWDCHFESLDIVSQMEFLESAALKNPICVEHWLKKNHNRISDFGEDADFQKIWKEDLIHYERAEIDGIKRLLKIKGSFLKQLEGCTLTLMPEIIFAAIPTFPDAILYADPTLQEDPQFNREATQIYENCLRSLK